jgi:predicted acylesterase/phospholipase RssA
LIDGKSGLAMTSPDLPNPPIVNKALAMQRPAMTIALVAASLALAGCATRPDDLPLPDVALIRSAIISAVDENGAALDDPPPVRQVGKRHDVLLLSGGGSDGAFGAGVMVGWSQTGSRPVFDVVTGVSTGALMATLAFLGPAKDPLLIRAYTQMTNKDIYKRRGIFGFAKNASLFDRGPLEAIIEEIVNDALLDEVAAEHRKGRRLFVASTDLDSGVSTVWDMGRIANSKSPQRALLYRQVLAASAAIPGAFSPVYIKQEAENPPTMHVDGSLKSAVLMRSYMVDPKGTNESVWAIVNGHLSLAGNRDLSGTNSASILGRSISEMLRTITYYSIENTYVMTRNAGAKFNLAYLRDDAPETNPIEFKPEEMKRLFDEGMAVGKTGRWAAVPPRIEPLQRIK